jgi:uncharacterized membrane protein (UPF0127 family)
VNRRALLAVAVALAAVAGVVVVADGLGLFERGEYDRTTVTVVDETPNSTDGEADAEATTSATPATATTESGGGTAAGTDTATPDDHSGPNVSIVDEDDEVLATVEVRVADTYEKRYTGLSDTESLEAGEGMLFVHQEEGQYAYVMRDMDFPLDIVFTDANGTITAIHHAPVPPEGTSGDELTRYRGTGKYVLEVPMGYTNQTGIETGDRIVVPNGTV